MDNLIEVVLHPVRMRILMAVAGRQMTAREISTALGDVPQATLYRHLNRLHERGVLSVVEERPIRGTVEKVYALNEQGEQMSPQELAALSVEDHLRYFATFVASLLEDFSRYARGAERLDLLADGVGYRKFPVELSDEELAAMTKAVNAAIMPYLSNKPTPERRRRIIATIILPDSQPPAGT